MKKKFTALLLSALLLLSLGLLSSCELQLFSPTNDESFPSDTRGGDGSRESWLAALENPTTTQRRLYEEALEDGSFTGTYLEFLETLGVEEDPETAVNTALRSTVSIFAGFSPASGSAYTSAGAGVIYSLDPSKGDALIVTNYHVVYSSKSKGNEQPVPHISNDIAVYLYGQQVESRAISATYLGGAMEYDIAVLKVTGSDILKETQDHPVYATEVVAADSDSLTIGEKVYAVGNPEAEGLSATEGVVSLDAEYIDIMTADDKGTVSLLEIRTDAAVNHGNSGGGLYNASGKLIGIVNARDEESGVVGFGYAIPSNLALSLAQNIIDTCNATETAHGGSLARLGITTRTEDSDGIFDTQTGKYYIEESVGVFEASYGQAAYTAGVRTGDTIVSAKLTSSRSGAPYTREVAVTRLHKLTNLLFEVRLGDTLELTVSRAGELKTFTVDYSNSAYFIALN